MGMMRPVLRRGGRVAEGAPLLREYTSKGCRGFESPLLRQNSEIVRKGDRVVEGACLENKCVGNGTEGSNPSLSATLRPIRTRQSYPAVPEQETAAGRDPVRGA